MYMKVLVIKDTKASALRAKKWWRNMGHPKAYIRKSGKVYYIIG